MKATILNNEIPVTRYSYDGREYLSFAVSGYDEIKLLTNKVLTCAGDKFTFSGWNSDTNECYFKRPLSHSVLCAKIA